MTTTTRAVVLPVAVRDRHDYLGGKIPCSSA